MRNTIVPMERMCNMVISLLAYLLLLHVNLAGQETNDPPFSTSSKICKRTINTIGKITSHHLMIHLDNDTIHGTLNCIV